MTHPLRRVPTPQPGRAAPAPRGPSVAAPILQLHRLAGNRAVTGLVLQRAVGWTDVSPEGKKGYDWNSDERSVGKVRRIPLEGLKEGTGASLTAKQQKGWHDIPALSSEHAIGKAIVLVPEGLDADQSIEVVVFLHGHTEGTHRPFAGFRTLDKVVPGASAPMQDLRRGIDSKDVAPVRDVALDQAEQQLEESTQKQLVIVIPQGGLTSQFSKTGGKDFDATPYINEIVTRLQTEKRWKDKTGAVAASAPSVTRIVMAGHSGAGAALSHMADAGKPGARPGESSAIPSDLVIYDAINGGQLYSFIDWATRRLDEDFLILTDPTIDDAAKLVHLNTAPKLRGYTTDTYISQYISLDQAIEEWFRKHKAKLGQWAPCLRANYHLEYLDVAHEELMRGSGAKNPRAAGTGTILDAINALRAPPITSLNACPAYPKPLQDRYWAVHPERRPKAKKS